MKKITLFGSSMAALLLTLCSCENGTNTPIYHRQLVGSTWVHEEESVTFHQDGKVTLLDYERGVEVKKTGTYTEKNGKVTILVEEPKKETITGVRYGRVAMILDEDEDYVNKKILDPSWQALASKALVGARWKTVANVDPGEKPYDIYIDFVSANTLKVTKEGRSKTGFYDYDADAKVLAVVFEDDETLPSGKVIKEFSVEMYKVTIQGKKVHLEHLSGETGENPDWDIVK